MAEEGGRWRALVNAVMKEAQHINKRKCGNSNKRNDECR
jgi:hypothetical protein